MSDSRLWSLKRLIKDADEIRVFYYTTVCGQIRFKCPLCLRCIQTREGFSDVKFHITLDHVRVHSVPWSASELSERSEWGNPKWNIAPCLVNTYYTDERIVKRVLEENRKYFKHIMSHDSGSFTASNGLKCRLRIPSIHVQEIGRLPVNICIFCCFSTTNLDELMHHVTEKHLHFTSLRTTFHYDYFIRQSKIEYDSPDLSEIAEYSAC